MGFLDESFPRLRVALLALVASPIGGAIALYLVYVVFSLAGDTMYAGQLRWLIGTAIMGTLPLAFLIFTAGLLFVLIGRAVNSPLRLAWCLLVGALFGVLHAATFGMAYYDPDDFIGEADPGWLGYLLQEPWFALAMTLPGIVSGVTFWLVSRALSRE